MSSLIEQLMPFSQHASWFIYNQQAQMPNLDATFQANTKYAFIGLNPGTVEKAKRQRHAWWQWHDHGSGWQRLCALYQQEPQLRNAYMTDIIKHAYDSKSENIKKAFLHKFPKNQAELDMQAQAIHDLKTEFAILNNPEITLLVFGNDAHKFMKQHFPQYRIIKFGHYARSNADPQWLQHVQTTIKKEALT